MFQRGDLVFLREFDTALGDCRVYKVYNNNPGIVLEVVLGSDLVRVKWQKPRNSRKGYYTHREDLVKVNHPEVPKGDSYLMFEKVKDAQTG